MNDDKSHRNETGRRDDTKLRNVESFYPLSPMQEGMLFHTVVDSGSGIYIELFSVRLHGNVDIKVFEQAWQKSVDRHPILRTSFVWEGVKEPIQIVHQQVRLPFIFEDWRGLSKQVQEFNLERYLQAERVRGFDLSKAPLMRLALFQTNDDVFDFVWIHHHILLDGWSVPILLSEVLTRYNAIKRGVELWLPPVRLFRDYILWLKRQDLSRSEAFWRQKLAGFSAPTMLPSVHLDVDQTREIGEFSSLEIDLSTTTTEALQNLAKKGGLTLNTLVLGAWAILLSRYSGDEDVIFGTTVSGRPPELPGVEGILGLFINTLPMRCKIDNSARLLPWLKSLQASQAEMRQYEYTPLIQIQGWSEVPRGIPLFESLLVFENLPFGEMGQERADDFLIKGGQSATHANFPLALVASPGSELSLKITFDCQWFGVQSIQRIMNHLRTLLEDLVADPNQEIGGLRLMSAVEEREIVEEWSRGRREEPDVRCVQQIFEEQVKRTPEAEAVVYVNGEQEQRLSYAELNHKANQLAGYLRREGVGAEQLVGICVERSLEMVIGLLGILKAGGAYLPLDPSYPSERLGYMLADSGVGILLTQAKLVERLPIDREGLRLIRLDSEWGEIEHGGDGVDDASAVGPENLAYMIYTSGSTGRPKGVLLRHGGLTNLVKEQIRGFGVDAHSCVLQFASFSFDASVSEIFMGLLSGGRLVMASQEQLGSVEGLVGVMKRTGVTTVTLPPSLLRVMDEGEVGAELVELRTLISAGEACGKDLAERWGAGRQMFNAYGPTEATIGPTYYRVEMEGDKLRGVPAGAKTTPIGKPIANMEVYVMDGSRRVAPVGVAGEIYLGGIGLAKGYLNQPELTGEKFVTHPWRAGERLYRTGDLGRWLPDGNLEYLGRIDFQVKVRGFRIELGEIEAVLSQLPEIKEAVVMAREDRPGEKQLAAYFVPREPVEIRTGELTPGILRSALQGKLPDYMIPSVFIRLDKLPLTANLKIDRKALPRPEGSRPELITAYEAPRNQHEKILADIFTQVLKLDRAGILDNFFDLGGDSILSLQVISRAKKAGIEINHRQLFENPTIQKLASLTMEPRLHTESPAEQGLVTGIVPLTPSQQSFLIQHATAPHHFNTSIMVEVQFPLDNDIIQDVLRQILLHHDILRARFEKISECLPGSAEDWQQTIVGPIDDLPLEVVDFSSVTAEAQVEQIQSYAGKVQASIDLANPPIMRVIYFNLGKNSSHRILFIFHHLVFDGFSVRIFVEDFLSAYLQRLGGRNVQLPPKTTSYKAWSERLVKFAQTDALRAELAYWEKIGQQAYATLSVDDPNGLNTYGQADHITLTLGKVETDKLIHQIPQRFSVGVHIALLTALARTFHVCAGNSKMLIELYGHGREQIGDADDILVAPVAPGTNLDLSRTIGWFTSVYPFPLEIETSSSVESQLKSVAAQFGRIPRRGIGYGLLRYLHADAAVRQKMQQIPRPEINFNYLGQFDQSGVDLSEYRSSAALKDIDAQTTDVMKMPMRIIGEAAGAEQDPDSRRPQLLNVVAVISSGELGVRWLYSQGMFQRSTILHLAETYMNEIQTILQQR